MTRKLLFSILLVSTFLISCKDTAETKKTEVKQEVNQTKKVDDNFEAAKSDYAEKGMQIAKSSGKTLKGKLKAAVDKGGLKNGITTCNKIAQKLMDSLSIAYNAKIKRTSLKIRNTDDKPDQQELEVLSDYHKMKTENKKLKPLVKKFDDKIRFYAPIFIDDVCLNCHGKIGGKLKSNNYTKIKELYPKDEAIDYKKGDLRAIWSITFNK